MEAKPPPLLPERKPAPYAVTLSALRVYGKWSFEQTQTQITIVMHEGKQYQVAFNDACHSAAEMLDKELMYTYKFHSLVEGLKRCGANGLYKHIMGEDILEAMKP